MRSTVLALALALALALGLGACGKETAPTPKTDPVTQAQAEVFAKKFETAMGKCTHDVEEMIDLETMLRMGMAGRSLEPGFLEGAIRGARQANSTSQMLCAELPKGGSYKLLRIRTVDGEPRPLFRAVFKGGGFNYHELKLGTTPDNPTVRAVDMYVYLSGENLSATFSDLFTGALKSMDKGEDAGNLKDVMSRVRSASSRGDFKGAKTELAGLTPTLRATKSVRLLEIQNEMELDEGDYLKLIDAYRRDFPSDPSIDMVSIDGYYLHKDFKGVERTLDRLEKRVGGDPYIDALRAHMFLADGKPADAVKAANAATKAEPDLIDGWYATVDADAGAKDYAGAVHGMEVLKKQFQIVFEADNLLKDANLAPIVASPEYKAFKAAAP
jgi:hypothetical protein